MSSPASSSAVTRYRVSSQVRPPSKRWSTEMRKDTATPGAFSLTARMHSTAKRARFSGLPPYSSVRWFHTWERNWSMRYPVWPWRSMTSNPASAPRRAASPVRWTIRRISSVVSARQVRSGSKK